MIAYLFWHRAYPTTTAEQYEEARGPFKGAATDYRRRAARLATR
jgi:hypothetical protein